MLDKNESSRILPEDKLELILMRIKRINSNYKLVEIEVPANAIPRFMKHQKDIDRAIKENEECDNDMDERFEIT